MRLLISILLTFFSIHFIFGQTIQTQKKKVISLPNGWKLSPAGRSLGLGDLPLNPNLSTFTSLSSNIDLTEKNLVWNELSEQSAKFDLTKEDRVPDLEFSEVIWKGVKGINAIMPAPKRSAFLKFNNTNDDD